MGSTAIIGDSERRRMKRFLAGWLFALLLAAGFGQLGRWQLHRAVEKQAMLDRVAKVVRSRSAQPLAALSRASSDDYAWVAGNGRFVDAPTLLLDNQRHGSAVGVHVFRVFQPEHGRPLLVDLGWRPLPADRVLPENDRFDGTYALSGLLMLPPANGFAMGPPYAVRDHRRWLLTRIDLPALSIGLKTNLAPRILRLDPALPIGYRRDLDVLPNTLPPEKHRGYAVQWFGMAIATLVTALVLSLRRRP